MKTSRKNLGQTMVEYVIIVALCAIGLLIVVTFFGNDVKQLFWTASDSMRKGSNQKVEYDDQIENRDFSDAHENSTTKDLDN